MEYSLTNNQAFALLALVLWDLVWRGMAMWRAGRNNQKYWFIALLLINSAGILPIIYLITNKSHGRYKATT